MRPAARVDSLPPVPPPKRRNPWTSTGEVFIWVLFAVLLFPATSAGTTTSPAGAAATVAAGKAVFAANNCAGCHTFKPANATGTIGPNLDTAPTSDAKADNNMNLADFIEESIKKPDAYIAKGYSKGIMPGTFGSSLTSKQLHDLVAFILSGSSKS